MNQINPLLRDSQTMFVCFRSLSLSQANLPTPPLDVISSRMRVTLIQHFWVRNITTCYCVYKCLLLLGNVHVWIQKGNCMLLVQLVYITAHLHRAADSRVVDLRELSATAAWVINKHLRCLALLLLFTGQLILFIWLNYKTHSVTDLFNVAHCQGK